MEEVVFRVHEDFTEHLLSKFEGFIKSLKAPCLVTLDIESFGGYTDVLKSMEPMIAEKKKEGYVIKTRVSNYAYSCGMFLFLLGDIREASDTASFMFHSSGFDVSQRLNSNDLREMLEMLEEDDAFTARVLRENTKVSEDMLEILSKNDNYLSKKDLIYLGFMQESYD
jgi:ATP-dependent protease ClpP protease subunit